jgi:hypothetical protein
LVFITINLYNFILCILNNFLKTYLKIITKGFTDGIYPSAFDSSCHSHRRIYRWIYSVGISHSPTTLPTDLICQYLTVPAIMTDECTDGYLRSVFQTLTDNFTDGMCTVGKSHYHRRDKSIGIFQAGNFFFWHATSVCKTIGKCFFYVADRYSDGKLWNLIV